MVPSFKVSTDYYLYSDDNYPGPVTDVTLIEYVIWLTFASGS